MIKNFRFVFFLLLFLSLSVVVLTGCVSENEAVFITLQPATSGDGDVQNEESITDSINSEGTELQMETVEAIDSEPGNVTTSVEDNGNTEFSEEEKPVPDQTTLVENQVDPMSDKLDDIVWQATHEEGNIDEWEDHGGFFRQGPTASYHMVTPFAHTGNYSVALTIDTLVTPEGEGEAHAAFLFFVDQLPDDAYYYSAWYYMPEGIKPGDWWNLFQWKSTYNGNTDYSEPTFVVGAEEGNGGIKLYMRNVLDRNNIGDYHQDIMLLPAKQWFQIEGYYRKAMDDTGQVIIWQDGVEVFNVSGVQTTLADNTVYWAVNNYTDHITPNPLTFLIDDAAISSSRLGPGTIILVE